MATPIQYVPQYIPMDIGTMSNILDKKQAQYNAGYAAPIAYEDYFAQIPVSPENVAGKNAILGNFQTKIQSIVDKYGGDYGAAAKDITREIARERQNPFYQMASQHNQALARQKDLEDKYGANAWTLKSVPGQFVTPEGKVISNINLDPKVVNQRDYIESLFDKYGKLGSQIRQSGLTRSKTNPQFFVQSTTRGQTSKEAEALKPQMLEDLYNMDPDLAKAVEAGDPKAIQIANDVANQLVGGIQYDYKEDPLYIYNAKHQAESGDLKNYVVRRGPGEDMKVTAPDIQKDLESYQTAIKNLNDLNNRPKKSPEEAAFDYAARDSKEKFTNDKKRALSKFDGPMLRDLMKNYGYTEEQAVNIVANEKLSKPIIHGNFVDPTAKESKEGVLKDLDMTLNLTNINPSYIDLYDDNGGKSTRRNLSGRTSDLKEDLKNNKISNISFDIKNKEIVLEGAKNTYAIPFNSLGNKGVSDAMMSYSQLMEPFSGFGGSYSVAPVTIGNRILASERKFNPNIDPATNLPIGYETNLYQLERDEKGNWGKRLIDVGQFDDMFFTELFSTYGTPPQYKPENIN